jgi:hypothetical protein
LKFRILELVFLRALPHKALLPSSGLVLLRFFFFVFFPAMSRRSAAHDESFKDPTQMPLL